MHDLIQTSDLSIDEIERLLALAERIQPTDEQPLAGRTLLLAFFAESTRTRASFITATQQLGGEVREISAGGFTALAGTDPVAAIARMSDVGDAVAIRHPLIPGRANAFLHALADAIDQPVLNMQCDVDHPVQTLADLLTLRQHFGADLRGRRVAVTWASCRRPARPASVAQGLMTLLPRFGVEVRYAYPPGFELPMAIVDQARRAAADGGGAVEHVDDMDAAIDGADAVYPRAWAPAELVHQPDQAAALAAPYSDWTLDTARFDRAAAHALVMHCLPAYRGEEVTDEVIDGQRSVIYEQAKNRLAIARAAIIAAMAPA